MKNVNNQSLLLSSLPWSPAQLSSTSLPPTPNPFYSFPSGALPIIRREYTNTAWIHQRVKGKREAIRVGSLYNLFVCLI